MHARRLRPAALLPVLVVTFLLAGIATASAITRDTVLSRAQSWIDVPVPYSQSVWFQGYRTDCSGFTSMSWATRVRKHAYSYSTSTMHDVSHTIAAESLMPGDALLKKGYHVRVFYGWVDATHTTYVAYEQTGPWARSSIKSLASDLAYGYKPTRYDHIADGPPPWNAIANPTFDVWASGYPVWWNTPGDYPADVCTRTVGLTQSGRSSVGLVNPSTRVSHIVELSQTVKVIAGAPYLLTLWANTPASPAGLVVGLRFFDASGSAVGSSTMTGASTGVGATGLSQMILSAAAPATATTATVSIRLAGGSDSTEATGTSAVLDDVQLYVTGPVAATLSTSKAKVKRRHPVILGGSVSAPVPAGVVRVYVIGPGKHAAKVLADKTLAGGSWSIRFKPKTHGTYRFFATYLGYGPYGQATTGRVSVRAW
jgi:hypothetical protein